MRIQNVLLFSLVALSLSLKTYGNNRVENPPAQSVDLGIRVVSHVAESGTVTTLAIGRADDADFMAAHPTAKPLYFAIGNLIVNDLGVARIGTPDELADIVLHEVEDDNGEMYTQEYTGDKERDLFGWADTTGWKLSMDNYDYPSYDFSGDISGNPAYDIARAKLGGSWRLPTATEWAFLMEEVALGVTANRDSPFDYVGHGEQTVWTTSPTGIVLTSISGFATQSIFLPSVGYRSGSRIYGREWSGCYWSGSEYPMDNARGFDFGSSQWAIGYYNRCRGFAVRPVSE